MKAPPFLKVARRIGLALTPGQTAFASVAFDGIEPGQLDASLEELTHKIFGAVDVVPAGIRKVVAMAKGRDAGGSRMGATRGLHLALTADLSRLDLDEPAYELFVAPKIRLARVAKRFALAAARRVPGLRITGEHRDGFTVTRNDRRSVVFECIAAARGGDTGRGVPVLFAMLDEAAFFRDEESGQVNDRHIFNALVPRILPGGQILIVSSPWVESGLLYDEFTRNHGNPTTALAAHCPTLVMRDDPETAATVELERMRDPENARREFDAEFLTSGAGLFFDSGALTGCIDPTLPDPFPHDWRPAA